MSEPHDDAPPGNREPQPSTSPEAPTKPRFEGPFKQKAGRSRPGLFGGGLLPGATGGSPGQDRGSTSGGTGWFSPWKIYGLGMLIGLALAGFYATKLMVTPEMVLAGQQEPAQPQPPPRPSVSAYCVALESGGASAPAEPAPFCSEGRPPACRRGDLLQLTYATNGATPGYAFAAVLTADLAHHVLAEAVPVRPGATEAPFGQWTVTARRARSPIAVVAFFSRAPLSAAEVAPFFATWRTGLRLLGRPPELPANLTAKGAELVAFQLCVGT